ncbi:hypothetical protein ACR30L_06200 [Psychromonas sp. PT13]|uniref:hypothetical protein n=1 Tax=Psychromonas sp. PT13 TaxID=3439547 RepID=UPI003EBA4B63
MNPSIDIMSQHQNSQPIHSDVMEVKSHVQRFNGECMLNTIMVDGYDCPFQYRREFKYKNLEGKQVDLSYYPAVEMIAGFEMEIMKVVHLKVL